MTNYSLAADPEIKELVAGLAPKRDYLQKAMSQIDESFRGFFLIVRVDSSEENRFAKTFNFLSRCEKSDLHPKGIQFVNFMQYETHPLADAIVLDTLEVAQAVVGRMNQDNPEQTVYPMTLLQVFHEQISHLDAMLEAAKQISSDNPFSTSLENRLTEHAKKFSSDSSGSSDVKTGKETGLTSSESESKNAQKLNPLGTELTQGDSKPSQAVRPRLDIYR